MWLLLVPAGATAQTVSEHIRAGVRTGLRVAVTADTGQEVKGRVIDVSTDALTIREGRDHVTVPYTQIVRIEEQRDSLSNGILIGLGAGTVFGARLYSETSRQPQNCGLFQGTCSDPVLSVYLLLGAAVGTAIGAAADALVYRQERTIFGRPAGRRVTVSVHVQRVQRMVSSLSW